MWPIGDYNRLVNEIKHREFSDIPVTFGVLIGDYRQARCREYILNYIEHFNDESDKWINFYLPGYIDDDNFPTENKITIKGKNYYFDGELYHRFLKSLRSDFGIAYTFNPILILFEYNNGHFGTAKRVEIDLDMNGSDIQNAGHVFENIFEIAKETVTLKDFSTELKKQIFKNNIFDKVVDSINLNTLKNVILIAKENNRYKVVGK